MELPIDDRICMWCQNLKFEAGFAYSEQTWSTGELMCKENKFTAYYSDNPWEEPVSLFKIMNTAKTCDAFKLNDEIETEIEKHSNK